MMCGCRRRLLKCVLPRNGSKQLAETWMALSPSGSTCRIEPDCEMGCKRSSSIARPIAWSEDFGTQMGKQVVGSLLLGLYDSEGLLNHVGFTSSFQERLIARRLLNSSNH